MKLTAEQAAAGAFFFFKRQAFFQKGVFWSQTNSVRRYVVNICYFCKYVSMAFEQIGFVLHIVQVLSRFDILGWIRIDVAMQNAIRASRL